MNNRVLLIGLFLLLSSALLRANPLKVTSATGSITLTCNANAVSNSDSASVNNASPLEACDSSDYAATTEVYLPPDIGGGYYIYFDAEADGWANAYFSTEPSVDVVGEVETEEQGYGPQSASFLGTALMQYGVVLNEVATPPTPVTAIPVKVKAQGDLTGTGNYSALASFAAVIGPGGVTQSVPLDGTEVDVMLTPGAGYTAELSAGCQASASSLSNQGEESWPGGGVQNGYGSSSCQDVVDPHFKFDQAAFDAEMGANTFPLDEYYAFDYSPNLTPEPSSFLLLGSGLVCLAGVLRRRLGRAWPHRT